MLAMVGCMRLSATGYNRLLSTVANNNTNPS